LPIAVALLFLGGCGRRTVSVSGTVVMPEGVKAGNTNTVLMLFVPESKDETMAPAAFFSSDDSSFVCKEILPGAKYKITVRIDPVMGSPDAQKRAASFETVNKTFDRESTKLTYQATEESSQSVTIDLGKGMVIPKK